MGIFGHQKHSGYTFSEIDPYLLQVGPSQYSKLKKNLYIVIKFHNTINFRDSEKVWFWCQGWKVIRYSHDELPDEMPSQNQASALFLNLQAKPSQ